MQLKYFRNTDEDATLELNRIKDFLINVDPTIFMS